MHFNYLNIVLIRVISSVLYGITDSDRGMTVTTSVNNDTITDKILNFSDNFAFNIGLKVMDFAITKFISQRIQIIRETNFANQITLI